MQRNSVTWIKEQLPKAAVIVWAGLSVVVMATLMVGHWFTLPRPDSEHPQLRAALAALLPPGVEGLSVAHFLYADCRCSQRILDHLLDGSRPADAHETIVLVGHDDELVRRATARGFAVHVVSPDELAARFGVTAAPLLAVADANHDVRYLGGYTDRKQSLDVNDVAIINDIRRQRAVAERPLFGCATSRELQNLLDPLGLKY